MTDNIRDRLAETLLRWWEGEAAESLRAVPEAIDSAYEYADALVPMVADLVTQGLADQRARCETVADELERTAHEWPSPDQDWRVVLPIAAERIRKASA